MGSFGKVKTHKIFIKIQKIQYSANEEYYSNLHSFSSCTSFRMVMHPSWIRQFFLHIYHSILNNNYNDDDDNNNENNDYNNNNNIINTVKPALVTTCLQRPLLVFPLGGRYRRVWL